jgi:hypothetical protein
MGYWRKVNEARHKNKSDRRKKYKYNGSRGAAYSQCGSKTGYPSHRYAKRVADDIMSKRGDILRVYHCVLCKLYHLTKHSD